MTIGINLNTIKTGLPLALVLTLALVLLPLGAQAQQTTGAGDDVQICHTAKKGQSGNLVVSEDDPEFVHVNANLTQFKGGNANAARHSRALALCTEPIGEPTFGGAY